MEKTGRKNYRWRVLDDRVICFSNKTPDKVHSNHLSAPFSFHQLPADLLIELLACQDVIKHWMSLFAPGGASAHDSHWRDAASRGQLRSSSSFVPHPYHHKGRGGGYRYDSVLKRQLCDTWYKHSLQPWGLMSVDRWHRGSRGATYDHLQL